MAVWEGSYAVDRPVVRWGPVAAMVDFAFVRLHGEVGLDFFVSEN